ncbi:hypothetical protein [Roseinatronobacter monicus]|nr:hypothetical protein [Roseinatronobacter monicus]
MTSDRYGPGVSMVDLEESAGHAAPPQDGFEPRAALDTSLLRASSG